MGVHATRRTRLLFVNVYRRDMRLILATTPGTSKISLLPAIDRSRSWKCCIQTVAGFTSLASMIALFSTAQLLGIGVVGKYLGRVHADGMGRPTYVIRTEVGPAVPEEGADLRSAVLSQ
jgi:hypothetical protein